MDYEEFLWYKDMYNNRPKREYIDAVTKIKSKNLIKICMAIVGVCVYTAAIISTIFVLLI